ncbi:hypothetical protein GCM10010415_74510 [Streptomyces atrovirens]
MAEEPSVGADGVNARAKTSGMKAEWSAAPERLGRCECGTLASFVEAREVPLRSVRVHVRGPVVSADTFYDWVRPASGANRLHGMPGGAGQWFRSARSRRGPGRE